MADMMDTLKGLLGDNADEKLSSILGILGSQGTAENGNTPPPADTGAVKSSAAADTAVPSVTPEMLLEVQQIMKQMSAAGNDNRSALLKSLKPFMRRERQDTIDSAIKLMSLAQVTKLFENMN